MDGLFRIQTYDGTQQPNRTSPSINNLIRVTGRMRQIITPLHKVIERQKSSSPKARSTPHLPKVPLVADLVTENPVLPHDSLATASLLRKRASPPLTDMKRRQLSHPSSTSAQRIENQPTCLPTPPSPAVDPSTFRNFSSSLSHSLSSSPCH